MISETSQDYLKTKHPSVNSPPSITEKTVASLAPKTVTPSLTPIPPKTETLQKLRNVSSKSGLKSVIDGKSVKKDKVRTEKSVTMDMSEEGVDSSKSLLIPTTKTYQPKKPSQSLAAESIPLAAALFKQYWDTFQTNFSFRYYFKP